MKNELKLGAILSYVSLVISNVIGIIYTPFMIRMMGQSEYGLYSLVASVVGYLTILDMGLGNAIVRYVTKYKTLRNKDEEYNLNGMFLILYTVIGIVVACLGIILYSNVDILFDKSLSVQELEKAKTMMVLLIFNLSVSFPLGIFGSIMTAYEKFVFPKVVNIVRVLINPLIMLPLLLMGYKSVAMVLVTTVLNIGSLLIGVWYCFRYLKIKVYFNNLEFTLLKEIAGYSVFIFLNIIIDKLYWSTDQFILGMVAGTSVVAIYAIASQLNTYYMLFSTSISSVFLPKITRMVTNKEGDKAISDLFIRVSRLQFIIMSFILTGFVLFGAKFISLWAGIEYYESYYIAIIVMIPSLIPLTQNLGISVLQAKNIHAFRSLVYLIIAIINIVLSIPLAKVFGGIGCAIATSIATILGQIIVMNIYYYKKAKIDIPQYWKEISRISIVIVIPIIIGSLINVFIKDMNIIVWGIKILIYSVIFIACVWKMAMNGYEKQLVKEGFVKVKYIFNK